MNNTKNKIKGTGKTILAKKEMEAYFQKYITEDIIIIDPEAEYTNLPEITRNQNIIYQSEKK